MVVASTFHHTLAYDIGTAKFLPVPAPCSSGVGAMTRVGGTGDGVNVLLLGRYTGEELVHEILDLEISALKVCAQ